MSGSPDADPDADADPAGREDGAVSAAEAELGHASSAVERFLGIAERLLQYVEVFAAFVLALLFAIGVFDLTLQIGQAALDGSITDPLVVVGFIDTALLLFIIVEVFHTVVAYAQARDTRRIVRLVVFTGIIALVRKAIVFRTGEYATVDDALLAAAAYGLLTLVLAVLLFVSSRYLSRPLDG